MGLALWTFAGDGTGTEDTAVKEAGTGSYQSYLSCPSSDKSNTLTRNSFTCTDIEVILWRRITSYYADADMYVRHPSYGDLNIGSVSHNLNEVLDWTKYRVWFWYDSVSGTKFGRVEKWVTDAWVQQGSDTNFGTGVPATASIVLKHTDHGVGGASWSQANFDELEVYDVVVE